MRSTFALATLALTSVATASVIPFDPDGPGPSPVVNVASFDLLPGNALLTTSAAAGTAPLSTLYYQARLGALLNSTGQVIPTPGLNAPANAPGRYEITLTFAVDVTVTNLAPGLFTLAPAANPRYFSMYFDTAVNADDLAGTGFRDGTRILGGSAIAASGSFFSFGAPTQLDNFGPDNYPAIASLPGNGGFRSTGLTSAADPAFFPAGPLMSFLHDSTLATGFFHIDPSASFEIGPDGNTLAHLVNTGPLNLAGPEYLFESDGAIAFTSLPEPAALSLLALAPLAFRRRP